MTQSENAYSAIARVYDTLNSEIDYPAWADFIEHCFDRYLPARPTLVLDLACGTGSMTRALAQKGYDMIGLDLSIDMLSVALERSAGKILYLHQDMKQFELYGTVGAVVCCLDSLNYLLEEADLISCFSCVHNYLDPDGLFVFDVNTPHKFRTVYGDNAYLYEDELDGTPIYCGWQNDFDEDSGICTFALSLFCQTRNGTYERADEVQYERCYTPERIAALLESCGFSLMGIYDSFSFDPPKADSERLYFVAKCQKNTPSQRKEV